MSTRSIVLVDSVFGDYDWDKRETVVAVHPIARVYRHCDGYPDGNGLSILLALAGAAMEDKDVNNRNWAQHFLKRWLAADMDVEFEPCAGEGTYSHGDLEWIYRIVGSSDYTGGKEDAPEMFDNVRCQVWSTSWDARVPKDYSDLAEHGCKLEFDGNWKGMAVWLRDFCKREYGRDDTILDADYNPLSWYCSNASENVWNNVSMASRGQGA